MSHIVVHPRILMVDNDKRAIEALTALLSKALPNAYVADDVTDGTKALSLCRAYGNQYDIILLDMSLEGLQGPDICKRIRLINNSTPILAMTSFSLNRYRNSAIESGAQGLVDKSSSEQFTQCIPRIVRGQTMDGFETPLVTHIQLKNRSALKPTLTVTQETIMHLCAEEYLTDDEIADRLHIAKATVRKHMQNIVQRLHCNTQRQAIAIWMNNHE